MQDKVGIDTLVAIAEEELVKIDDSSLCMSVAKKWSFLVPLRLRARTAFAFLSLTPFRDNQLLISWNNSLYIKLVWQKRTLCTFMRSNLFFNRH